MIYIKDKQKCCGCSSCVQVCPKQCISFNEDEQGFRYPLVDHKSCISCGLCEKVCPCINTESSKQPLKVFAAINPNEEQRMKSSSGGIFTLLAESVIDKGGVVFGARFNENWEVIHSYVETKEELKFFRGSKYVQSQIGETFKQAQEFLKANRIVLFSATPCQISGLKKFLHKEYENLITVDVVCHGVPSPKVWRDYLFSLSKRRGTERNLSLLYQKGIQMITGIDFRNKSRGWKNYRFIVYGSVENNKLNNKNLQCKNEIINSSVRDNIFMKAFLNNLILRPSCFNCPSKSGKSYSDFSLADFWSIKLYAPQLDDGKGVSLLYVHTNKALQMLQAIEFRGKELDCSKTLNTAFSCNAKEKYPADKFWIKYEQKGLEIIPDICNKIKPSPIIQFIRRVISFIKRRLS